MEFIWEVRQKFNLKDFGGWCMVQGYCTVTIVLEKLRRVRVDDISTHCTLSSINISTLKMWNTKYYFHKFFYVFNKMGRTFNIFMYMFLHVCMYIRTHTCMYNYIFILGSQLFRNVFFSLIYLSFIFIWLCPSVEEQER